MGEAHQTSQPRVPAQEKKASKLLAVKTYMGCGSGRNSQPHWRVRWRDPWRRLIDRDNTDIGIDDIDIGIDVYNSWKILKWVLESQWKIKTSKLFSKIYFCAQSTFIFV